jgi:signal transduction histidine kinase
MTLQMFSNNETVPIILTDSEGKIQSSRNLDSARANDKAYLSDMLVKMKAQHQPIEINYYRGKKNYLYYSDSKLFAELKLVLDDLIKSFISEVAINTASVPVIYTDSTKQKLLAFGNIDSVSVTSNPDFLKSMLADMEAEQPPIEISLGEEGVHYIFYKDSFLLTQLKYYPYVQFGVIGLFLIIAYALFSTSRKAEQNQVWVGMAKETAHQLGTPLSSLIAWVEYLKLKENSVEVANELEKDVKRLEIITERFSKIGSPPQLEKLNVKNAIEETVGYLRTRISKNVNFSIKQNENYEVAAQMNAPLFSWVIENLCRNAVDAMDGNGSIDINIQDQTQFVYIDITDTGKGIAKSRYKTIFQPGYTTKKRGWGLGLSLCKRIIENYHQGDIFVKGSELGKGTTFRIVLKK